MRYIRNIASGLIDKYGTNDPFEICSELDVFVFYPELPKTVKGFYYNFNGYRVIGINSELDRCQRRVVCAHELGHSMLHPDMNVFFATDSTNFLTQRFEREADYFSACLLIDSAGVKDILAENEQLTLQEISNILKLPEDLVNLWFDAEKVFGKLS